jgi:mRNA-degrading endonuclease RelE of RelBE toxin-antitoxin system
MAKYQVEFLKSAAKELSRLPKDIQVKIRDRAAQVSFLLGET